MHAKTQKNIVMQKLCRITPSVVYTNANQENTQHNAKRLSGDTLQPTYIIHTLVKTTKTKTKQNKAKQPQKQTYYSTICCLLIIP